jgi:hypothetical protein
MLHARDDTRILAVGRAALFRLSETA